MKMTVASERFEVLDSWRGICAVMVIIYHFIYIVRLDYLHWNLLSNAYLFVDFFFVLSGFVVCHAYRDRLRSGRSVGGFLLRRIGRLWPLHIAVLFAFMLAVMAINISGRHPDHLMIEAGTGNYSMRALLLNAALLNSMGFYGVSWNGPAWSIGAEFYTYALFAAVTLLAGARRLVPAALVITLLAMGAILIVAPTYMNSTADYGFIRCIAGFFAGVVAYHAHQRLRHLPLPMATLWEVGTVALAGLFIASVGTGPDEVKPISVLAPVAFGAAILVFAREGGWVSVMLRARPLRALGCWSYSIYLIHMPLLILLAYGIWLYGDVAGVAVRQDVDVLGHMKTLYDLGDPLLTGVLLAGFVGLVIALAAFTYARIEEPWRDRFTRIARNYETRGRSYAPLPSRSVMGTPIPVRIDRRGR
ncbi:acyltransferase family protein [Ancylobacter radicis]|uniref:Acyltransferase n=1 Tax=Ancylobacter radicis TaxID=2836179 RepID=A0ABS5RC15_9HYPH|nr:acyltransferase [Ancylobacter radicis]MBS9478850.1 acyltransferase [Ancylobacter radicis]